MKKIKGLFFGVLVMLFSCSAAQASGFDQNILKQTVHLLSGETTTIQELLKEKPVYLKFWATWCQPCLEQMPHLQETYDKFGDKIHVIAVNIDINDDLGSVKKVQKDFNLTMSVAMDSSSELAQAFNLIGTPYHLLLTQQGKLVHKGHEASKELDNKIGLLANKPSSNLSTVALTPSVSNPLLVEVEKKDRSILFFTATWCDWYLADSRPTMAKLCMAAQKISNDLHKVFPEQHWMGIASRLWTGETDLKEYLNKHSVTHNFTIDTSNEIFVKYKIKNIPTLLILEKGKVLYRTSDFNNLDQLNTVLSSTKPVH